LKRSCDFVQISTSVLVMLWNMSRATVSKPQRLDFQALHFFTKTRDGVPEAWKWWPRPHPWPKSSHCSKKLALWMDQKVTPFSTTSI